MDGEGKTERRKMEIELETREREMQIDEKVKENSDGKAGQDINDKKQREVIIEIKERKWQAIALGSCLHERGVGMSINRKVQSSRDSVV